MNLTFSISPEAQSVLNAATQISLDRTASNLKKIRIQTRLFITPAVTKILDAHNVTVKSTKIMGVSCLLVHPSKLLVDWPILYGFGGGFVSGSAFEDLTIAAPISAFTGAIIIIPEYRLAPENPWPAALDDAFNVYRTLVEQPFALVGESAGGNLALALIQKAKKHGLPLPNSLALLSPWCNLLNTGDSLSFNNGRDPALSLRQIKMAAQHFAGKNDLSMPEISPIFGHFDASFPPCLISTATRDLLLSQSVQLAHIMRDKNILVDLQVWEGLWHVFEWDSGLPESEKSLKNISKFLTAHMV